ncbi:TIGR04222 domain-containing membrane protein [Ramlibacter rhizophilus]|uniref:TIGR04222 domain-containing membrane protein n=1 Tax=Ramlibacter rhizophilus TaxID=1781167 RepID=A0A4Z0C1R5_9BURK|nr:TIGR04222 domain-containing membrane protein [Ramlibacter rhizophilus]TFZ04440.1 TIGR04222 domain-containing membrane protein [Ramlibacter rhizophilus]
MSLEDAVARHAAEQPTSSGAILARLDAWSFTPVGAAVRFEEKLAREQGWTLGKAMQVIHEYRRFLMLTQVASQPVCPSKDVDAAWHLHLMQTREYRSFCIEVLGRFLHHEPSREGPQEFARHRDMYIYTLEAYRATFGETPDPGIWPSAQQRFSADGDRLPDREGWALGPVMASAWVRAPAIVLAVVLLAVVSASLLAQVLPSLGAWPSLGLYLLFVLLGVLLFKDVHTQDAGAPMPVDAFETAYLAGGQSRALAAAVGGLIARGVFRLEPQRDAKKYTLTGGVLVRQDGPAVAGPLEPLEAAVIGATSAGPVDVKALAQSVQQSLKQLAARLVEARLITAPDTLSPARVWLSVWLLGLCALGWAAFFAVPKGGSPFAMVLFGKALVFTLLAIIGLSAPRQEPTGAGRAALASFTDRMASLKALLNDPRAAAEGKGAVVPRLPASVGSAPAVSLAVALFGSAALMMDPRYAGFNFLFEGDAHVVTGDSGSTGGCEAGGGCGGCGGCG